MSSSAPTNKPSMAALIDILKSSPPTPSNTWSELEDHVRNVYQTLLDLNGENVVVGRDVQIRGRAGSYYQIDVYYEFDLVGLRHRVAIECKNTKRPVERDEVLSFKAKIDDCPGIRGVIVAANGYQSGAKKFAEDNNLTALSIGELPSIAKLIGLSLENVVIPSEESIGQPFWTLYDAETLAPFGFNHNGELLSLLFFSRTQAQNFTANQNASSSYIVRGLEPRHLGAHILTVDSLGGHYSIVLPKYPDTPQGNEIMIIKISRRELIREYYVGRPLPEEPSILPSMRK